MQLQQNKLISTGKSMINSTFKTNFVQFFFFVLFSLDQTEQSTVYENLFGTTAINDWQFTVYNQYCNIGLETCDTSTILSINQCQNLMYDVFLYKTFQLQAHYELSISFKFWRIDNWQNKKFLLYIDLQLVYSEEYSTSQGIQNICQDSNYNDEIYQIQKTIDHFYSSATIIMIAEQGYWGISEIVISIADCPQGCESCNQNGCINENLFLSMLNYILINSISDSEGWITDGILQTYLGYCLDFNYLRSQGDHLIKEFQLESHSAISFQFKVIILNSNPTLIQIEIDDVIVETIQYSQSWVEYSGVLCSYITLRYVKIQSYQHNNINLKLAVKGSLNLFNINYSGPGIRIRDFKLFLQSNQNNVIESAIYFYEYSDSPINLEGCSELINSVCWNCFEGWQFNQLEQSCIPICGDRIITQFEECDDGNNFPYDGCHLCKFSCPLFCNQCLFGKCFNCQIPFFLSEKTCQLDYLGLDIFKILQYQEPYLQNQVTFFPKDDINVQNQYQIDYRQQLNEIQNLNKNISQSQNLDQNEYHFTKIDNCRNFQFGTCLQCHESYEFNLNKKQCLPKCSDGIIIQYEECDDQNNIQFDRCYKCQMSCQIQCITCKNSICLQCLDGWQLLEDTCQQICGDGQIAILSIEQCDDGNNQAYDGCYECKFECDSNCLYCVDNYYCLLCKTHFELNNNYYCQPICGDGIIIQGFEDCDNSNNDQSDSECDIGCEQCELGSCKQCNLEYQLINGKCNNHQIINNINQELEIYQSIDKCGDGILGLNEECDDQNNNDNDGCSKLCQIEANWNCYVFIYQPSDCFQKTSLFLSYLNQTNQYQYVKISFTNNIDFNQIPDNFNSSIKFIIQDVKKEDYAINFLNVIDTNQKINQSNYELEIEMKKSFQSSLTLIVWIESILFDENLFIVDTGKKSLKLKPIKILSQTQISISNTFKELGFGMLLGLGCSSILLFIFGSIQESTDILNILVFQSNLRFINADFPQNLEIYFQSSDFVSLQFILQKFQLIDIFDYFIGKEEIYCIGKFLKYNVNAELITNLYGLIIQIILLFGVLILINQQRRLLYNQTVVQKIINYIEGSNSKILVYFALKLYHLNKAFLDFYHCLNKHKFSYLLHANTWDLNLKFLLFVSSNHQINTRSTISLIICLIYFILLIRYFIQYFIRPNNKIILINLRKQQHEGVLVLKTFVFLLILVNFQTQPIMQCILLTFVIIFYLVFIIQIKIIFENYNLITTIWIEAPVMIFIFLSLAHCQIFQRYLSANQSINLGFIQIGILIFGLIGPLIRCGTSLLQKIQAQKQSKPQELSQICQLIVVQQEPQQKQ